MIILVIKAIWASAFGRIISVVLAGVLAWQINNAVVARSAVKKHVEKSVKVSVINAKKARKARSKARKNPGKHIPCRDC